MTDHKEVVAGEIGFEQVEVSGLPQEGSDPALVTLHVVFPGGSGWSSSMTPSEARKMANALIRAAAAAMEPAL